MNVPATIRLRELALAGGHLGRPIPLCFQGYSTPLLAATWCSIASSLAPKESAFVDTRSDLNEVTKRVGEVRAVFVRRPSLLGAVGWASAAKWSRTDGAKPCVLAGGECLDFSEYPGVCLVLNADQGETESLSDWLTLASTLTAPKPDTTPEIGTAFRSILAERLSFEEVQIVESLLFANCATRVATLGENDSLVTVDDYKFVRQLLRHPVVRGATLDAERLAVDMVGRANVYLAVRHVLARSDRDTLGAGAEDGKRWMETIDFFGGESRSDGPANVSPDHYYEGGARDDVDTNDNEAA